MVCFYKPIWQTRIHSPSKRPFMKKILVSLLLVSTAAFSASAASKMKKNRGFYIDHSKDVAYSAAWADKAVSPAPDANFALGSGDELLGKYLKGDTWYYGLNNFTLHGVTAVNMNAPYYGGEAPSWDGPVRNNYRNMRAYNESEPLPSNAGTNRRKY